MPLGVESVSVLEEVFPPHGGAVIDENGEGVCWPFLAVGLEGFTGLAPTQTDTRRRPEAQRLFDDGQGVGEAVDKAVVLMEPRCGSGGVGSQDCVVLFPGSVENFGVVAECSIGVLKCNELVSMIGGLS